MSVNTESKLHKIIQVTNYNFILPITTLLQRRRNLYFSAKLCENHLPYGENYLDFLLVKQIKN